MRTSRSNMRRLRAGLIGSINAWLPSRRSTAHHSGARLTTRSGQVRSASRMDSTSSANGRYRLTGIDDPRWIFHAGWPTLGWPAGLVMVRLDANTSGDSTDGGKLVTVVAPGFSEGRLYGGDRRVANTPRGGAGWIKAPRRGRERGPAAR